MRGVSFTRRSTGRTGIGVIAQEVREVLPEIVFENKNGLLSVDYGNISAVLIEAIKDLKAEIDALKKKLP